MKKNIYTCTTCGNQMKTGDREPRTTPMFIGCNADNCKDGVARSGFYLVDQNIEPDLIFIKPKSAIEWKAVQTELVRDIQYKWPKKKESKVIKMMNRLMAQIREHVKKGGLVMLRREDAEALETILTVCKN